ncbi:hypothetical protein X975_04801, partial [Stegodyphus mimosarum]
MVKSYNAIIFGPKNVLMKNLKMTSKKVTINEKPKVTKMGFFRRSESVMPSGFKKPTEVNNTDASVTDNKNLIRRSSMICSE